MDQIASNLIWNERAEAWDADVKVELAINTNNLELNVHADSNDVVFLAAYLLYKDGEGKARELAPASPLRGTKPAWDNGKTAAQNAAAPYAPLADTAILTLANVVGKAGTLVITAKNNAGHHATKAFAFDGSAVPGATVTL